MILLSENQQSVLSFLIALLRPQASAHGRTLQHPAPDGGFRLRARGRPRAEAYRPLRSGSGDPPRAKFGVIAARGSGGNFLTPSPDKSENAEEISFPRCGGHGRSPSSATPHAGSAISPRAVALPRLQDCWAFARAFESNGKTPRERGFVKGHIFEFRPSRNDAVGDRVYSPRSLQKKAPMALISLDAELKSAPRARSSGEDCRRRRRPLRFTRCRPRASLPTGRRPRRARRRWRAFPR